MFVAAPEYSGQVPNLFAPTEFEGLALNNAVTTIPRTYFASKLSGERINAAGIEVHMNMSNQQANSINRVYLEHEPSALSVLFLSFFRSDDWTPFIQLGPCSRVWAAVEYATKFTYDIHSGKAHRGHDQLIMSTLPPHVPPTAWHARTACLPQ
jgi:hypothetical protein